MTAHRPPLLLGLAAAAIILAPLTRPANAEGALTSDDPAWVDTLLPDERELELLTSDDTFEFVNGGVLVADPPPAQPLGPALILDAPPGSAESFTMSEASVAYDEAFTLHSNPGADRVIYLDFDGHVITGTAWNNGRSDPIIVGEYSREPVGEEVDGFSQFELDGIVEIWESVAEDYAPWPVDVTTEHPGEDALHTINRNVDGEFGSHVVITHDHSWYGNTGGVAYVGAFGNEYYSPAFVFSRNLPEYAWVGSTLSTYGGSPKSVGEAAAHEVGHHLGLGHDGVHDHDPDDSVDSSSAYYAGHANSDWAPIMGVGYYKSITHWSNGDYPNANQQQDDLAIIDGFIPGRQTGSTTSSLSLDEGTTTFGTLSDSGATVSYELVVSEGPAVVRLQKESAYGNLLAELEVVNDTTGATTVVRPDNAVFWSHTVSGLEAGSYTVKVRSVGWDDPAVSGDEFTDYGSMGRYVLSVDGPNSTSGGTSTTTTTIPTTTSPPKSAPSTTVAPTTTTAGPSTTTGPNKPLNDTDNEPDGDEANRLTTFSPIRLLDTRLAGSRLDARDDIRLSVAGVSDLPDDARAAIVNVTAVNPSSNGYISITPCNDVADADRTSSLNFVARENIANSTTVTLSDDGDICLFASAATDIVVDITATLGPSGASGLTNRTSQRVVDSRSSVGISQRLTAGVTTVLSLRDTVDPTTAAVAVNVTAVRPASNGYLTINDCASSATTAALNFSLGTSRGNNGVFALSPSGTLCVTSSTAVDLVVDLTGEFGAGGSTYLPAEPVRLLDTRPTGPIRSGSAASYAVPNPADDQTPVAASINIASAGHVRSGYVTSWDCGPLPESSALNPIASEVTANGALASLSDAGRSCLFNDAGGDLIVDLNGWWI